MLVEAVIAVLLTAIAVTAMFSVMLSGSTANVKSDRRQQCAFILQEANERLKSYITADNITLDKSMQNYGICGDTSPLTAGDHNIDCLLEDTTLPGTLGIDKTLRYNVSVITPSSSRVTYSKIVFTLKYPGSED